jgi:purine nucleosidase
MVAFQAGYSFWDTVATAWLEKPKLFTSAKKSLGVITGGADQGTIAVAAGGPVIDVADTVNVKEFYKYLMVAWKGAV